MRQLKRKPSLQDTMEQNARAMRGLCALGGKDMPPELEAPVRKSARPRVITKQSDDNDLEAAVMREVGSVLALHPKVLFAVRQNSGAMQVENAGGKSMPIWFYKWSRSRVKMRITDFWGMLTDGRVFALEAKRRNWVKPSGTREAEQLAFILTVRYAGGCGGFVTSGIQAKGILDEA